MAPMPKIAMAMPPSSGGKDSIMIAWLMGIRAPPAAPCTMRKNTSAARFGADPQKTEAMVKMMMQEIRKRFLPKTRASQPVIGIMMALLMRYEVRTQVTSSVPAFRLPCIWGSATLAIEVSTISIKAGIITVRVMSHLFIGWADSVMAASGPVGLLSRGMWSCFLRQFPVRR